MPETKQQLTLEIRSTLVTSLKPAEYNPRKINKKQMAHLERSIKTFGFVDPVIANKDGTVIAGHQRIEVACRLGMTMVPVIFLDLSKSKEQALNVALNKIRGNFDQHMLADLFTNLEDDDKVFTGYEEEQIDGLLKKLLEDDAEIATFIKREKQKKLIVCPECSHCFDPDTAEKATEEITEKENI
jgi:ParB-like chromosome segregation protein Spo0J